MIRLTKGAAPAVLTSNAKAWTDEFIALKKGESGVPKAAETRYAHDDVKNALRRETSDKCAYCEGKIQHVSFDHIEHILPKAKRNDLVVEWTNLTIACPKCNHTKLDYYEPTEPLINPFVDDPSEHLVFSGPFVLNRLGSDLGIRTIQYIGLDRTELIEARGDRIKLLHPMLDLWKRSTGATKAAVATQIEAWVRADREFSAALRSHLVLAGFPLP